MLEQRTAETLLQKPLEIVIGDKEYEVAKPTFATLIEVSRYIAKLPKSESLDKNNVVPFILDNAEKYGNVLAEIAAVMILGAQNIKKVTAKRVKSRFLWFKRYETVQISNVEQLAHEISMNASCEELSIIISQALSHQNIGFFLSTIISLSGANLSEPTKNATEATAHGE